MMLLEVGQAASTAAIAVWPALPMLLVRAVLGQVFQPATRAAVPALVGELDLTSANVALGFGENGLTVAGPVLAAVLVAVTGIRGLLLIGMASVASFDHGCLRRPAPARPLLTTRHAGNRMLPHSSL